MTQGDNGTRALVSHGGPHVFVEDLEQLALDADDAHHLRKALRMRVGERLTASDGAGAWRSCLFTDEDLLEANGDIVMTERPRPSLRVGFALVKGARPELVVQKLTELGIDEIQPFAAERSVVRWDSAKQAKNQIRLERIAREAAMQSHRAWLPVIAPFVPFSTLAAHEDAVRADMYGAAPTLDTTTILIGPEGGWSPAERSAIPATVGVGPHVLRAETAAIAVAAVWASLRFGSVAETAK